MSPVELESRIQDLFEGVLAEDMWPELRKELLESEQACEVYHTYAQMHSLLGEAALSSHTLTLKTPVVPVDDILVSQKKKSIRYAAFSAAALLLIGLVLMQMFFINKQPTGLSMKVSPGSEFSLSHDGDQGEAHETRMAKGSRLQLSQGAVELTFASGVKSIVMAPADMTLHDDNTLYMNQGTAWFHVPSEAVGFQVKTREFDIVDLGAEFGVRATPDLHDEVHVITGKIKVTALGLRKETATLTNGQARKVDAVGRLVTIPSEASAFVTSLPKSLPYMHWSFDDIEDGSFRAAGNHSNLSNGTAKPRTKTAQSMHVGGRFGKAVRFRGDVGEEILTQWLGISGSRPRTVACWIKATPGASTQAVDNIVSWGLNNPGQTGWHTKWKLMLEPGLLHASGYQGRRTAKVSNITDGEWHHIACTHRIQNQNKLEVHFYVDGQLVQSRWHSPYKTGIKPPNTITRDLYSDPVLFGADLFTPERGHLYRYRGQLDEIYIFEGVLSASSIHQLATENIYSPDHPIRSLPQPSSNQSSK